MLPLGHIMWLKKWKKTKHTIEVLRSFYLHTFFIDFKKSLIIYLPQKGLGTEVPPWLSVATWTHSGHLVAVYLAFPESKPNMKRQHLIAMLQIAEINLQKTCSLAPTSKQVKKSSVLHYLWLNLKYSLSTLCIHAGFFYFIFLFIFDLKIILDNLTIFFNILHCISHSRSFMSIAFYIWSVLHLSLCILLT